MHKREQECSMGRLEAKVALVTGSGTGIGRAMAERFAAEGAHVVVCGDREPTLLETVGAIQAAGGRAESHVCDVTDETAVAGLLRATSDRHGRLDILVNNAFRMSAAPIESMTTSQWKDSFSVAL